MAKVVFGVNETPVAQAPTIEKELPSNSEQVAKQVSNLAVAAVNQGGLVLGDKIPDFSEVILPRINLVQNIGELKDTFPVGAVVFNQTTVLFTPPILDKATGTVKQPASPPALITVCGFRPTRFVEKVKGGGRGLIVNTEAEVRANGGTTDYKEFIAKEAAGMKRFEVLAEAVLLVEKPENLADDDTTFVYPVEGKKYALALWGLKGTAYTAAAKRVFFTARQLGCLRTGYPSYSYCLSTKLDTFNGGTNSAWVPVCLPNKKSSPEFLAFVASILQAPEASAAE